MRPGLVLALAAATLAVREDAAAATTFAILDELAPVEPPIVHPTLTYPGEKHPARGKYRPPAMQPKPKRRKIGGGRITSHYVVVTAFGELGPYKSRAKAERALARELRLAHGNPVRAALLQRATIEGRWEAPR